MLSCQAIVGSQCNVIFDSQIGSCNNFSAAIFVTYEACVSDGSCWIHTFSFEYVSILALVIDGSVVDCGLVLGVYLDVIAKF